VALDQAPLGRQSPPPRSQASTRGHIFGFGEAVIIASSTLGEILFGGPRLRWLRCTTVPLAIPAAPVRWTLRRGRRWPVERDMSTL